MYRTIINNNIESSKRHMPLESMTNDMPENATKDPFQLGIIANYVLSNPGREKNHRYFFLH